MSKRRKKKHKKKTRSQATYEYLVEKGKEFSEDLRRKATDCEKIFFNVLKELKYSFEFQVPIVAQKKHLYILDFLLTDYKIFCEIDGSGHFTPQGKKSDNLRTARLRREGFEPLRFTNRQVNTFTKDHIDQIIKSRIMLINVKDAKYTD